MRDLHKVREQERIVLSVSQVYIILGLLSVAACLVFIFGFYMGRQVPVATGGEDGPLVPADIENDSVALLLARAAEEEAEQSHAGTLDLRFHDILPVNVAEGSPATSATSKATPTPVRGEVATLGGDATNGDSPDLEDALGEMIAKAEGTAERAPSSVASVREADQDSSSRVGLSENHEQKEEAVATGGDKDIASGDKSSGSKLSGHQESRAAASKGVKRGGGRASEHSARSSRTGARPYTVQVSSFQNTRVAEKLVRELRDEGYSAYKVAAEVNGHTWYRVRVGSYDSRERAELELERLRAAHSKLNPMITRR